MENLQGINTGEQEGAARLSADEKTMVLARRVDDNLGWAIHVATRDVAGGPFGTQRKLPLQTGSSGPSLANNGRLYYTVDIGSGVESDPQLHYATAPYSAATSRTIHELNSSMQDAAPFITPSGSALYFARRTNAEVPSPADLFVGYMTEAERFTTPVPLPELNTVEASETAPMLSADGLYLYFASDRPGGKGKHDVYVASRADTEASFGPAAPVHEVNSPEDDFPSWISADHCRLYLSSRRHEGAGQLDIYLATRR